MSGVLVPVVAIILSMGIPIVAIVAHYWHKRNKFKVLEKAIEHGVSLEGLSLDASNIPRMPYRTGMITLAVGLGIGILAVLIGRTEAEALGPILGAASIPTLVGIALLLNDKLNYDRYFKDNK